MNNALNLFYNLSDLPILIQIVWFTSGVLFLLIVYLIFYLYYLRNNLRNKEVVYKGIFNEFESNLISYLYLNEDFSTVNQDQLQIIDYYKKEAANSFKRKILIAVLTKLKNDISGEMAIAINQLYIKTGLMAYSLQKLKSNKWHKIALGIKELTQFEITNVYNEITKFQNYPKQEVRNQVQLYYVSLFHFNGLDFLNTLKTPISEWNQIQLLEILQKFEDQEITDITPWLKSSNISVVLFSLKLAKIYNQFQVIDTILTLLNHYSKEVRITAMEVLGYFQSMEMKEIIISNFKVRSLQEQVLFFKILDELALPTDENFVIAHTQNPNFEIRFFACKIVKKWHPEKINSVLKNNSKTEQIFNFLEAV